MCCYFARNIEQGATHVSGLPASLTAAAAKERMRVPRPVNPEYADWPHGTIFLLEVPGVSIESLDESSIVKGS